MTVVGIVRVGAGLVLLTGLGVAAASFAPRVVQPEAAVGLDRRPELFVEGVRLARVDSTAAALVGLAPFRADRTPAAERAAPPGGPTTSLPKPSLKLTAVAFGPVPAAIIEGFGGSEAGRVVVVGDTALGLKIRAITARSVVIVSVDTTWTLRLDEVPP